jgi:hypothetical protein
LCGATQTTQRIFDFMGEISQQFVLRFYFIDHSDTSINQHALLNVLDFYQDRPRLLSQSNGGDGDLNGLSATACHRELATIVDLARTRHPDRLLQGRITVKQQSGRLTNQMAPGPPKHRFCCRIRFDNFACTVQQ